MKRPTIGSWLLDWALIEQSFLFRPIARRMSEAGYKLSPPGGTKPLKHLAPCCVQMCFQVNHTSALTASWQVITIFKFRGGIKRETAEIDFFFFKLGDVMSQTVNGKGYLHCKAMERCFIKSRALLLQQSESICNDLCSLEVASSL